MISMIKMTTCAKEIIKDMVVLAKIFYPAKSAKDAGKFLKLYEQKNQLNQEQAIKWYTQESFLYRLVNRVLRVSRDPTCLYIIQPYFKNLFWGIVKLYQKQQKQSEYNIGEQRRSYKKFTCYRGGQLSQAEMKYFKQNVSQLVQNLGFLSTSRQQDSTQGFVKNALFEIEVDDAFRKPQLDYGFADVSSYSYNKQQQQVLFNPLNSFKIISFGKVGESPNGQPIYKIKLKYGELARAAESLNSQSTKLVNHSERQTQPLSNSQDITKTDTLKDKNMEERNNLDKYAKYKRLGLYQIQFIEKYPTIYKVLIQSDFNVQGSEEYCKKFAQIATESKNIKTIIFSYYLKCVFAKNKGDLHLMRKQCQQSMEIMRKNKLFNEYNQMLKLLIGSFDQSGYYKEAIQYLKNEMSHQKQLSKECLSTIYKKQGELYSKIGQYVKAIKYFKKSFNIQQINEYQKLILKCEIGYCYQRQGKRKQAIEQLEMVYHNLQEKFKEEDQCYAQMLKKLADSYTDLYDYQKALVYLKECQEITKQTKGLQHPSYAFILYTLGQSHYLMGNYQKAFEKLQKSLAICQNIFGQKHPKFCPILSTLTTCCIWLGKHQQARNYIQFSLSIKMDDLNYIVNLHNLGNLYIQLGQYLKAVQILEKSLRLQLHNYGQGHLQTAQIMCSLGQAYYFLNKHQQSVNYLEKCLAMMNEVKFGICYLAILNSLANSYNAMGKYQQALKYLKQCLQIHLTMFGKIHPNYPAILNNLAQSQMHLGKLQQAIQYLQQAQKIMKQNFTYDIIGYASVLCNLGQINCHLMNFEKANSYFEKCLQIRGKDLYQNHPIFQSVEILREKLSILLAYEK